MKAFRWWFMVALFLLNSVQSVGQDWNNLLKKGKKALGDVGNESKAKLDSADFQFAISINENAGFFDVAQKGEAVTKGLYLLKDQADKTQSEKMRDALDTALIFYNRRMFKIAEQKFLNIKKSMEAASLTQDLTYLKCQSNLGLVYLTKGQYDEAAQYFQTSIETSSATIGTKSAAYAANLNNSAKLDQQ